MTRPLIAALIAGVSLVWVYKGSLVEALGKLWIVVGPGGKLHPASFLEHQGHLFIELLLLFAIGYLLLIPRTKPIDKHALTKEEVEELCNEWTPEPLVPVDFVPSQDPELIIEKSEGNRVIVDGEELLNADCTDFLGLMDKEEIREACRSCVEKYGVGSCGPRAFYGTTEPHLSLEAHLAKFLGTQESIVYSYDIATVSSVLPAFANRKDVIVVDEHVYFGIQSGCQLSRAQIHRFKHNDLEDLERLLVNIDRTHKTQKKPLNRRFIVVEGIYYNGGDLAKLGGIFELKKKYKYRLVVDESLSLGVLGKTGKGACEEFGLGPGDVEIVTASMSNALASIGGFCAGDHDVIGHQRLNGNGYIFSASLPPYLAVAADQALSHLEQHPESFSTLRARSAFMREILSGIPGLRVIGNEDSSNSASPIIHLELSSPREDARGELARIAKAAREQSKVIVSLSEFSGLEWEVYSPSLRLAVTLKHSKDDLVRVKEAIEKAVLSVCNLA